MSKQSIAGVAGAVESFSLPSGPGASSWAVQDGATIMTASAPQGHVPLLRNAASGLTCSSPRQQDIDARIAVMTGRATARMESAETRREVIEAAYLLSDVLSCDGTVINRKLYDIVKSIPLAIRHVAMGTPHAREDVEQTLDVVSALLQSGALLTHAQLETLDSQALRTWIEQEMAAHQRQFAR